MNKMYGMVENLKVDKDPRVLNCAGIMEILLNKVDDLQEEVQHLQEENEGLRFDLDDKKHEEGPRRRSRRDLPF